MGFVIGSYNLCKWSDKSLNDNNSTKSFLRLANIIENENFDVIALQEVFGGNWLKQLCKFHLSDKWDFCFDIPPGSPKEEGYAFIWKKSVFRLSNTFGEEKNPKIYEDFKIPTTESIKIKRAPFYIRLTPVFLPKMEIRLINTHMMSSDSGNVPERQAEYKILIESIIQSVLQSESNKPRNNMDFYTFLLGDYNLTLAQINKMGIEIEYKNLKTPVINKQENPTTLSNNKQNINQIYTDNDFDHFSYGESSIHGAKIEFDDRVEAVTKYFGYDGRDQYKAMISDHVPIKFTLSIK